MTPISEDEHLRNCLVNFIATLGDVERRVNDTGPTRMVLPGDLHVFMDRARAVRDAAIDAVARERTGIQVSGGDTTSLLLSLLDGVREQRDALYFALHNAHNTNDPDDPFSDAWLATHLDEKTPQPPITRSTDLAKCGVCGAEDRFNHHKDCDYVGTPVTTEEYTAMNRGEATLTHWKRTIGVT